MTRWTPDPRFHPSSRDAAGALGAFHGTRLSTAQLAGWSFLMSSAHGAGLMLLPVLATSAVATHAAHPMPPGTTWTARRPRPSRGWPRPACTPWRCSP